MLKKLKAEIKELAKSAVIVSEEILGSNKGKQKKAMAIKYIVNRIPLPVPLRLLISFFLSSFIDDAVEFAVEYMNNTSEKGQII